MRISSFEEYALRVALWLAREQGENRCFSAAEIARCEGLSAEYAAKILHLFKCSSLVTAQRGVRGGFRLAIRASEVSVAQVFSAIQECKETEEPGSCNCFKHKDIAHLRKKNNFLPQWKLLFEGFEQVLNDITLADLLSEKKVLQKKIKSVASHQLSHLFDRHHQEGIL